MKQKLQTYEIIDVIDEFDNGQTFTATAVEVYPDNPEAFRIYTAEGKTIWVEVDRRWGEDITQMTPEEVLHTAWRAWYIEG